VGDVRAKDLMGPVRVVRPEDPAGELVRAFQDPDVRAVAVVTEVGELVGSLSDEDMLTAILPSYLLDDTALAGVVDEHTAATLHRRLEGKRVKDLVEATRREHPVVSPEDTLIEVAVAMCRSSDPAVLVVAEKKVLGVIPVEVLLPSLLRPEAR
jgi:predicted transcriptional regulator